jgi:methyl-accepting chemotaxis protein
LHGFAGAPLAGHFAAQPHNYVLMKPATELTPALTRDKLASLQDAAAPVPVTMDEIVASVCGITGVIGEVTVAASEQSTGLGQVNQALAQLDHTTQQNAALVEQSAAAAAMLSEQAEKLAQAVGQFKLAVER